MDSRSSLSDLNVTTSSTLKQLGQLREDEKTVLGYRWKCFGVLREVVISKPSVKEIISGTWTAHGTSKNSLDEEFSNNVLVKSILTGNISVVEYILKTKNYDGKNVLKNCLEQLPNWHSRCDTIEFNKSCAAASTVLWLCSVQSVKFLLSMPSSSLQQNWLSFSLLLSKRVSTQDSDSNIIFTQSGFDNSTASKRLLSIFVSSIQSDCVILDKIPVPTTSGYFIIVNHKTDVTTDIKRNKIDKSVDCIKFVKHVALKGNLSTFKELLSREYCSGCLNMIHASLYQISISDAMPILINWLRESIISNRYFSTAECNGTWASRVLLCFRDLHEIEISSALIKELEILLKNDHNPLLLKAVVDLYKDAVYFGIIDSKFCRNATDSSSVLCDVFQLSCESDEHVFCVPCCDPTPFWIPEVFVSSEFNIELILNQSVECCGSVTLIVLSHINCLLTSQETSPLPKHLIEATETNLLISSLMTDCNPIRIDYLP